MKVKYKDLTIPLNCTETSTISELFQELATFTTEKLSLFADGKPVVLSPDSTIPQGTLSIEVVKFDPDDEIVKLFSQVNEEYLKGNSKSIKYRTEQLTQLRKMLQENEKEFRQALIDDLKDTEMVQLNEIHLSSINEINGALDNLSSWMAPQSVSLPLGHFGGSGQIVKEAFGVVLLISPWNYPISLVIKPLVGIIAAGNACVIKPSEVSASVSRAFAKFVPKYLDNKMYRVVEGGPKETTTLLALKWDYIFYTGSTSVGKIIMEAAAKHLTPTTLELGGKSPCIVLKDCDLDVTAKRITWGSQTCIAPDYILIEKSIKDAFCKKVSEFIIQFYGENPQESTEYSRIITERHTSRLQSLLPEKGVYFGGKFDVKDRYFSPTIVVDPSLDSPLMQDEIFGPILPVIEIDNLHEAIKIISKRPKPLALYIFSSSSEAVNFIIDNTSSGAVEVNECIMHFTIGSMPFGGVGESGMGAYGSKFSFDTFSHSKPILRKGTFGDASLRYPPYTTKGLEWLKTLSAPSIGGLLSTLFQ